MASFVHRVQGGNSLRPLLGNAPLQLAGVFPELTHRPFTSRLLNGNDPCNRLTANGQLKALALLSHRPQDFARVLFQFPDADTSHRFTLM